MCGGIAVVLFALVYATFATEFRHPYVNKGWIPITNGDVLSRNNHPRINYVYSPEDIWDLSSSETEQTMRTLRDHAIKVIMPVISQTRPKMTEKHTFSPINTIPNTNVNEQASIKCKDGDSCNFDEENHVQSRTAEEKLKLLEIPGKQLRMSKAIKTQATNSVSNKIRNFVYDDNKINISTSVSANEEENKEESQIYEVVEDTRKLDTPDIGERHTKYANAYFYQPPQSNINNAEQNNITNIFFDILSRYNIRPQDQLQNYDLSRLNKGRNQNKHGYAIKEVPLKFHIPPRTPHTYNSQNHLPVDPLLAVFLSNYGYYIPGMYGQNVNYRNLYGYLASNNIHNNLPFGLYKLFADTDSSN